MKMQDLDIAALKRTVLAGWRDFERRYADTLEVIQGKAARGEKITIAILAYQYVSVDNFSRLYPLLASTPEFKVTVVISPYLHDKTIVMIRKMRESEVFLQKKGIPYMCGYDYETHEFLNVNEKLMPDIVLTENDYDWNHKYFLPESFHDSLYYFIPYGCHLAANTSFHAVHKIMNQAYKIFSTIRPERCGKIRELL